jgi:hypothetical protein
MNIKTALSACALAIAFEAFGLGNVVAANLLSGDVDIVNYYPNLSTPYNNGLGLVEGSGPTTSTVNLSNGGYSFTFTADTLTFVNPYAGSGARFPQRIWRLCSDFLGRSGYLEGSQRPEQHADSDVPYLRRR